MGVFAVVLAAFLSLTPFSLATSVSKHGVSTSSGYIIGHQASNRSEVTEWLGIRYAKAPVGELRYAPPERFSTPWNIYEAKDWSPDCPNNKPPVSTFPEFAPEGLRVWKNFASQNGNPQDEDCLKLNIWSKSSKKSSKKPVFVWFHGGRYTIPGPHSPFYNGQYFADTEDVVVVTPNYRLGVLGFSGAPGLPQNAALRDQRTVVEWVHDNIAGFGGDPSRVIIFGQSAGGSSVDYFAHAYQKKPIVSGLISHSGTSLSFVPNNMTYAQNLWYNVSGTLGCGGISNDSNKVLTCMRSANITALLAAAAKAPALPSQALTQATFHPTVDNEIVFADYESLGKAGAFSQIPYMTDNTDYESGWYKLSAFGAKRNLTEAQWDLYNQRAFTCPTGTSVQYRVEQGVPTWRYRYHGTWDNLRLYGPKGENTTSLGRGSGAYHGSEIGMVFGTAQDISGLPNTKEEDKTSRYMMGAWAAFGRDSKEGLKKYGWPEYKDGGKSLVRLGFEGKSQPSFVEPKVYDSACPAKNDPLPGQGAF